MTWWVVLAFAMGVGVGVFVASAAQWWASHQRRALLIRKRREMAEGYQQRPFDFDTDEERERRRELLQQWEEEWPL